MLATWVKWTIFFLYIYRLGFRKPYNTDPSRLIHSKVSSDRLHHINSKVDVTPSVSTLITRNSLLTEGQQVTHKSSSTSIYVTILLSISLMLLWESHLENQIVCRSNQVLRVGSSFIPIMVVCMWYRLGKWYFPWVYSPMNKHHLSIMRECHKLF